MLLFVVAYLGGVLTIVSPCILPVVPFVFARADRSFVRSGLPMCAGMAVAFCAVGTLAAVGGSWAVDTNQYGRVIAMVVLTLFGLFLLVPALSDRLFAPLAAIGGRVSRAIAEPGAMLRGPGGAITYRFHARDLHLVLAAPDGKPVRFRVTLHGAAPGQAHGVDTNPTGEGVVTGQRLYQLIRQSGDVRDRTFEITFLDAGVQAYAFRFG